MELTIDNYKEFFKGICVVEISGESCANCISLMPVLNNIISKRNDCRLLNIEANMKTKFLMDLYEVRSVPAILIVQDGVLIDKTYGFQVEEILEIWINMRVKRLHNSI